MLAAPPSEPASTTATLWSPHQTSASQIRRIVKERNEGSIGADPSPCPSARRPARTSAAEVAEVVQHMSTSPGSRVTAPLPSGARGGVVVLQRADDRLPRLLRDSGSRRRTFPNRAGTRPSRRSNSARRSWRSAISTRTRTLPGASSMASVSGECVSVTRGIQPQVVLEPVEDHVAAHACAASRSASSAAVNVQVGIAAARAHTGPRRPRQRSVPQSDPGSSRPAR